MSEKSPQKENEEVDLIQLFNLIGKSFERFFKFIGNIFKLIFKVSVYSLKPIVENFKVISISIMIAAIIGYGLEKFSTPVFSSNMLVKPYFESKYNLVKNINYYNSLIVRRDLEQLSRIFEIDTTEASELLEFSIEVGPEDPNQVLQQYDQYIKSIDSTLAEEVSYTEFIENREILRSDVFSIQAKSSSQTIFQKLSKGFEKIFENEYSTKMKKIRDSVVDIEKRSLQEQLVRVDSLQSMYIGILKEEVKENRVSIGIDGMLPLKQDRVLTREYELFQQEVEIRNAIRSLNKELVEKNSYYDILAEFAEVGSEEVSIWKRYSLMLPLAVLIVMILSFIFYKAFSFIKDYE